MLGVRATAITACLSGLYRMSKQNIVRFYTDIFNLSISTGMVCKTEKVVSKSLERPVEALKQHIQSVESEVGVHADETGFKECGQKRWAWVGITAFVAVFIIRQRRSKQVAKELLGESFSGILCSDRYSAYNWIPSSQRQLCWAHLERDFCKLSERTGTSNIIGAELLALTHPLFHHWHEFKEQTINRRQLRR